MHRWVEQVLALVSACFSLVSLFICRTGLGLKLVWSNGKWRVTWVNPFISYINAIFSGTICITQPETHRVSRLYPGFFVYHSALLRGFIVAFAVAILHLQMQSIEQFRAQVVRTNTADFKFPCRCDLYYTGISLAFLNIRVFDGFLDNVLHTHVPLPPRVEHDLSRVWKMIGRYDGQKD